MKIKTYPLQFTEEKLKQIGDAAGKGKIKSFIHAAIDEKLNMKAIWKDLIDELDLIINETQISDPIRLKALYTKRASLETAFNNCEEEKL